MQEVRRLLQPAPQTGNHSAKDERVGNQVLLTSRIVGYQFDPLTELPHYTIEEMEKTAIAAFCQTWLRHVARVAEAEVTEQVERLQTAIFDETSPGIQSMAGNPLLLTIMAE